MKTFLILLLMVFSMKGIINILKIMVDTVKKNYLLTLSVVTTAILSILFLDHRITPQIIKLDNPIAQFFSDFGYILGKFHYVFFINLALFIIFYIKKDKERVFVIFASVHALIFSGIFVQIPKYFFGRLRPHAGYDSFSFFNNYPLITTRFFHHANMSMPSGDTITIAAAVMVFAAYTKNRALKIFLLSIPIITMFTRLHLSKHWFSDTLIGLFLGYLIGYSTYEYFKTKYLDPQHYSFRSIKD